MNKLFLLLLLSNFVFASGGSSLGGGNTLGLICTNGQVPEWSGTGFTACLTASGSGTVTSVNTDSTSSGVFANTANVIGTAVATLTYSAQTKNTVWAGPTTGSNAVPTYRALVGADLPLPGSSSLGGVFSKAAITHQFLNAIVAADGSVTSAQPAFTDISGSVAAGQMPALTGDVTTSAGAVVTTVAKIQGTMVNGITGTGNVAFSDNPTFTTDMLFSDGTNVYNVAPKIPTGVTCTTTGTVNFNTEQSATVPLTLTSTDTCVLTIAGTVTGGSYVLHVLNASTAVLTLPTNGTFGGATYTPGSAGTYDNIGIFVVDSVTPYYNYSVIGTGYLH